MTIKSKKKGYSKKSNLYIDLNFFYFKLSNNFSATNSEDAGF